MDDALTWHGGITSLELLGASVEELRNIEAAGIAGDPNGPFFRSTGRKTGRARPLWQQNVYRMIQRQTAGADVATRIGNHTFRAMGITACLKTTARWNTRRASPTTPHCGQRGSMTGGAMRFRSTR
jgi:hypothetical protein